jgi:acetylornithine deacetylase/succinyl-diaminopimelate desuccinylase-like protein
MEFIRFPSISTQPQCAADVKGCAEWLAAHLRRIGLERVTTIATPRHPLVMAEWRHAPGKPTVLIYGHYDVQPVDPLREWRSPPFEPVVRGANLYGRGSTDDKGQLFAHIKALEAYLRTERALPVNVLCLFEGEEEVGSPHLLPFLARNRRAFSVDCAVVSDMPIPAPDRPALTYALRGGLALELEARGPQHDLHSGLYGGAVLNPIQGLCEIVARLHDRDGRIAIPGFYDRVRRPTAAERAHLRQAGPTDGQLLREAGVERGWGERSYTEYERSTLRPALTFNGIQGGYEGTGSKKIIPARAAVKLSFRLVPDQDPNEIEQIVRQHIARIAPPGLRYTLRAGERAAPALLDPHSPYMRAAAQAYRAGFGVWPTLLPSGGSIPVVNTLEQGLGIPTVLMGFGLPADGMHAPNEKFHLPNFYNGIATSIAYLATVGGMHRQTVALAPSEEKS